ncbi:uncharacterized protein LOC111811289 isoform X1 [Cucurbita pepo subsp. pepo]|uniref:uncharacterized protein LOC111811289 isoform X1 n=1 Tax=Cucurbita pepo subsp. pepo TaxID=3664 RepID=UPI000C9D6C9F|nr:uncharacterized protein LOC111811289 isoform X1 [Cucurbita pepo subsp. pepo]XP_023553832.1 uncharacterized protein LOC111811289 isoform X1 [Cucurbita pepo subsp. pepo]
MLVQCWKLESVTPAAILMFHSCSSLQMRTIGAIRPQLTELFNRSCFRSFRVRALSSSSLASSNQSRGGLPRFFSQVLPSYKGDVIRLEGDEVWHMTKVLRLKTDDRVELFNGNGGLVEGSIKNVRVNGLDILAMEDPKSVLPQSTQWHVFAACGTLKGGRADWLVEKCTELGASSVTPLLTERCATISDNRVHRFERITLAATKQCQRLHQMSLNSPLKIYGLLHIINESKLSFVAVAEATPLVSALASIETESGGLLVVGPEGDFTEKEVNMMKEAGAIPVGLGPYRLRVETATVAILSTLMLWSDSKSSNR